MLFDSPVQDFATTFVKTALNYVGCKEPKTKKEAPSCYIDIVTYNGKELSLEAWCAKFVWGMLDRTAKTFGKKNPLVYTASTLALKKDAEQKNIRVDRTAAPGSIFFKYRTGGGHVGIVSSVNGSYFQTVEGNYDDKVESVKRNTKTENYYFIHVEDLFKKQLLLLGINSNYLLIAGGGIAAVLYFLNRSR